MYTGGILMGVPRRKEVAVDKLKRFRTISHDDPAV